jgi:hypothetical protein
MLESARNIMPGDESPAAQTARQINDFDDFNGLTFRAKLKTEKSNDPQYKDKNQIKSIITPDMSEYGGKAVVQATAGVTHIGQAADAVVAKVAAASGYTPPPSGVPAWAK